MTFGGRIFAAIACVIAMFGIAGCVTVDRNAHADALGARAHLQRETLRTGMFALTAYSRITRNDAPIHVYIEGDGFAWVSRSEPSLDPTPREATALALAAADSSPNVVYLARPCQFTPMADNPRCDMRYWTGARFSPDVVASMNEAMDAIASRAPGRGVDVIGYSGGGAIAVLLAARRRDVRSLRTVAGNLGSEYVNRIHDVSPMPASLDPIDAAASLGELPQLHFTSDADRVVPPAVAQRFAGAAGTRCARVRVVADIAHDGDWARAWPALLRIPVTCNGD
ncbi:Alpha/beta hydrolase family protein [Caballeronia fortuita]|uniref:Alpha/beta hydrolase family protein n=1 Tax=Caballeronia fortuita TaxID=1777138 RepID=A0A158E3H2_9BURK|nr:alpha/beta hydrolase [Caballeronia fortuita]SAL00477.1 Alpha/beta hydrolase family protein [Caballeronia fortuita]